YTVSDGRGGFASATATINVLPVNDSPIAVDDFAVAFRDTPLRFDGLNTDPPPPQANDTDADGDFLWITSVGNATHGIVQLQSDGAVVFTPAAGYTGSAEFDYTVTDGQATAVGHVNIDVRTVVYFSTTGGGTLTGTDGVSVPFTDADILQLSASASGAYSYRMFFDGSDVGLSTSTEGIDAFTFLPDGSIIISTTG